MVKRRRGLPARSNTAQRNPERSQAVAGSRHPDTVPASATAVAASVEANPPADLSAPATMEIPAPSVHDVLLETVSADALQAGTERPGGDTVAARPPVHEKHVATAEPEPAPVGQPPDAVDATQEPVPALQTAATVAPEPVAAVAFASESPATVVARTPETMLGSTVVSFDMIGEITEANATILAFLRNEGSAAMAHWQSLSGARTPADAIRIQVDEMQRAADASLSCFSVLARRAGRVAAGISRS